MECIPDNIANLSNSELRKALIEVGIRPAPLTPTTRKLYQRKLAKNLIKLLPPDTNEPQESEETDANKPSIAKGGSLLELTSSEPTGSHGNTGNDGIHYVITFPTRCNRVPKLFTDKAEAWNELRNYKGARVNRFDSYIKANRFIQTYDKTKLDRDWLTTVSEQEINYVTPKQTELNQFAQAIENNDDVTFDRLVLGNPRYLISSADGPVPLKPSTRYNALHVAARSGQADMVRKVIRLIEDPNFHKVIYGEISNQDRVDHIVDLYLNTPEKGNFETPLHLASKHGFVGVVSELLACPAIDRNTKNKYNETAFDVAGTRCKELTVRREILDLLREQYFVPLVRCHDNTRPPIVLPPWTQRDIHVEDEPSRVSAEGVLVISALAGPMGRQEAAKLHKQWVTPDRRTVHIRRSDADRGGERIGREIVKASEIPWLEYWDFLENYADFSNDDGLRMLEVYLENRSAHKARRSHSLRKLDSIEGYDTDSKMQCIGDSSPVLKKVSSQTGGSPAFKDRQLEIVRNRLLKERQKRLSRVETIAPLDHRFPNESPRADDILVRNLSERFSQSLNLETSPPKRSVTSTDPHLPTSSGEGPYESETNIGCHPCLRMSPSPVFIVGDRPSKVDVEVFDALTGVHIDDVIYPNVARWKKFILSRDEEEIRRWETPRKCTKAKFGLPDECPSSPLLKKPGISGT